MLSKKHQKSNDELVKETINNPAFRDSILKDPKAAIEDKFQVKIPDDKKVFVHENKPNEIHYVLPPAGEKDLTDEELDEVAGGNLGAWSCSCHPCLAQCT